jgi:hypothetical protein
MFGCCHRCLDSLVLWLLLQCFFYCLASEFKKSSLVLYIILLICYASCFHGVRTFLGIYQHWFVDVVVCVMSADFSMSVI